MVCPTCSHRPHFTSAAADLSLPPSPLSPFTYHHQPVGEFFAKNALQRFVQDPKNPAHLINHDNEYLNYKDDW